MPVSVFVVHKLGMLIARSGVYAVYSGVLWVCCFFLILVLCSSSSLVPIPPVSPHCTQSNKGAEHSIVIRTTASLADSPESSLGASELLPCWATFSKISNLFLLQ